MNRTAKIGTAFLLAAALTGGTWFTAQSVKSPEQSRQETQPPAASVITQPVEQRALAETVKLNCLAGYARVQTVEAPASGQVLTAVKAAPNKPLAPGDLIADVQGSPLIALGGAFPLYRDLKKGDTGPDADLLRASLAEMGFAVSAAPGTAVDEEMLKAARALLAARGYSTTLIGEAISKDLFTVISPDGGEVTQVLASPGKLSGPLLTLGVGTKKWICTGSDGTLPVGLANGQKAVLTGDTTGKPVPIALNMVEKASLPSNTSDQAVSAPAAAAPPDGASEGSAQQSGGISTASASQQRAVVILRPSTSSNKETQTTAQVILRQTEKTALVVPASALWTKDGRTVVTVREGEKNTDIPVKVTMAVEGSSAVVPEESGQLKSGQNVVVSSPETVGAPQQ